MPENTNKVNQDHFKSSFQQDPKDIEDSFKIGDFSAKYFSRKSSITRNSLEDPSQNAPNMKKIEGGFENKTSDKEPPSPSKELKSQGSATTKESSAQSNVDSDAQRNLDISSDIPSLKKPLGKTATLPIDSLLAPIPSEIPTNVGSVLTLDQSLKPGISEYRVSNSVSPIRQNLSSAGLGDVSNPHPNTVEIVGRHLVNETDVSSIRSSGKRQSSNVDPDNFDSLQLQGGDISREVYNWQREHAGARNVSRRRSQSFSGSLAESIPSPDFQVQDIRVPGGFRRSFLIQKQSKKGLVDDHKPTFITNNFIEFLTLYGHFAGEELRDEEDEESEQGEEEEEGQGDEESLLLPSVRPRKHVEKHKATTPKAVLLLLKAFLGTGVLFLPRGFRNGGWLFAVSAIIFFAVLSYFCFISLVDVRIHLGAGSYGDIALKLYGNSLRKAILASIVLSQIGFSAAYIVFTATNLQAFVISTMDKTLKIEVFIVLQLVLFLPLSLTRKISKLSGTALIADVFIFLGLFYVFYYCSFVVATEGIGTVSKFNSDWTVFIGTAIFTYEGIGLLIPIQESMRKPAHFPSILGGVMITATVAFLLIGTIGYFAFGEETDTVILLNFPQDSILVNIIQFLYATAILLSTPLQLFPAIRILENGIIKKSGKYDSSIKWQKNYFRIFLVSLTALIGWCGASDLDKFVAIVGSFACIPLIYIFPPLLHLKALAKTRLIKTLDVLIIMFGGFMMIYTSYQTVSDWIR